MNNLFKTPCTQLSSALISYGIPIISMKKMDDGRVFFFFKKSIHLNRVIEKYYSKDFPIDAQTLLLENKTLKQRISNL